MRSKKYQKNFLMSVLLLFTVFLYGCGGSAGVQDSTVQIQAIDVTTKAPIENVQIIATSSDPNQGDGLARQITRQLSTDSRGKATFSALAPDRAYDFQAVRDGYSIVTGGGNDGPPWVPDIHHDFILEQGKTYTATCYLRRENGATTGSIRGYIRDRLSNQPITDATVYITPTGSNSSIIDSTNKPSKPGYYELNDIPSGTQSLIVVAPGYQSVNLNQGIVIPAGGTIDYDVYLETTTGNINVTVTAKEGDLFSPGYVFVAQVLRNGTEVVSDTLVTLSGGGGTDGTSSGIKAFQITFGNSGGGTSGSGTSYAGPAVPVLPSGSNDTYTIKITSDDAHMVNPANGITGIVLKASENPGSTTTPTVNAGTITMAVERGQLAVTLYQVPYTQVNLSGQNDTTLREQASQASIIVVNGLGDTTSRYTGESPNRYFHYLVENMPVGSRSIIVNFPGHDVVGSDDGTISNIEVLKDRTSGVTRSVDWHTN